MNEPPATGTAGRPAQSGMRNGIIRGVNTLPNQRTARWAGLACAVIVLLSLLALAWPDALALSERSARVFHLLLSLVAVSFAAVGAAAAWDTLAPRELPQANLLFCGLALAACFGLAHAMVGEFPLYTGEDQVHRSLLFSLALRLAITAVLLVLATGWTGGGQRRYWLTGTVLLVAVLLAITLGPAVPDLRSGRVAAVGLFAACAWAAAARMAWRAVRQGWQRGPVCAVSAFAFGWGMVLEIWYPSPRNVLPWLLIDVLLIVSLAVIYRMLFVCNIRAPYEGSQRSEAVLRALVEHMPFEAWVRNRHNRVVLQNPALTKRCGDLMGLRPEEVEVPPEERAVWHEFDSRIRAGEVIETERPFWTADGRSGIFFSVAAPILVGGEFQGSMGFNIDITRHRRAEIQLRDSEAQLSSILGHLPGGVSRVDQNLRFLFVNQLHADWLSRPADQIVGRLLSEVAEPAIFGTMQPVLLRALAGELVSFETRVEQAGRVYYRQSVAVPERAADGEVVGVVVMGTDVTDRKNVELALTEERSRLSSLVRTIPDIVFIKDMQGRYLLCNRAFEEFFQITEADMIGCTDEVVVGLQTSIELRNNDAQTLEAGRIATYEEWMIGGDGQRHLFETTKTPLRDTPGRIIGVLGVARDITERKAVENALKLSRMAIDGSSDAVFWVVPDGRITDCNTAACALLGYSREELLALNVLEVDIDLIDTNWGERFERLRRAGSRKFESRQRTRSGQIISVEVVSNHVQLGDTEFDCAFVRDITERKNSRAEIERLAFYDPLTSLPNRRLLLDRLGLALAQSQRQRYCGALLFLDLDNFKDLNDTLGHDIGDDLLRQVAQRLRDNVRDTDTVARLGGDEFVAMLEQLDAVPRVAAAQAEAVAAKLLAVLNTPYGLGGNQQHYSTPSIGIALFDAAGEQSVDDLLKRADLAMYQSKAAGRNTIRFFDPAMQAEVSERSALEADLRQGLQREELVLYYQPVVNAAGIPIGAEALVRWRHPQRGIVSPVDFIPLAEQTGLILPLGQWVLQTACEQLARWHHNPVTQELTLAVNVSARQFRHPEFAAQVQTTLQATGAAPGRLKLELTESLLLTDTEDTIAKMTQIKALGVGFSLDDFGTGYSSLSYLKRLPLDQLKIDQSFVRDVLTDPNDAAIAKTILALAHTLDLTVVAEGVEGPGQFDFLVAHGCREFQGFMFGRPMPIEVFEVNADLSDAGD